MSKYGFLDVLEEEMDKVFPFDFEINWDKKNHAVEVAFLLEAQNTGGVALVDEAGEESDEDIGLANPDAQIHTVTALQAAERIGFPEARILIANIVIDLALSPKSNSAYVAMDKALADLRSSGNLPIPRHLRDGHYAGSKELGNAQNYKYPHNYPGNWVNQDYLPDKLKHASYFIPNENGKYERALGATKEKIDQFKKK